MSRKPHDPLEPEVLPGAVPGHAITLAEETAIKQIEQDQFALAMQDIGSMRALDFVRQMSSRVQVEIYLRQKKTKAYMSVPHPGGGHFSSLDDFCEAYLGESGRNIRRKVDNYHLLGSELLEVSERLGFKGKDYTILKALPADDQELIKQAMSQEADRDQVIDLLQEMAVRHASEKAALTAQAKEAEETAEARSEVIARKESRINEQEETIHKLKRRIETATPDQVGEQLRDEVGQFAFAAEAGILGNLRAGFQALMDHGDANNCTHENFMSGCLAQIEAALLTIRGEFNVKTRPDADPVPGWLQDRRPAHEIVADTLGAEIADFNARHAASGK